MSTPTLSIDDTIATITLQRPTKANRLEPDDLDVIAQHIDTVNHSPRVVALVFRSHGKYFCSGFDISKLGNASKTSFEDMVNTVEDCRAVTLALIHGGIYGGATDLALACDFRIGADSIDTFMPAAKLGLIFNSREMIRYVSRIGLDNTKKLFLMGQRLSGKEMKNIGFLTHIADDESLQEVANEIIDQVRNMAPLSLSYMKKHLNAWARHSFCADQLKQDTEVIRNSADLKEGKQAWLEKRKPNFTGR